MLEKSPEVIEAEQAAQLAEEMVAVRKFAGDLQTETTNTLNAIQHEQRMCMTEQQREAVLADAERRRQEQRRHSTLHNLTAAPLPATNMIEKSSPAGLFAWGQSRRGNAESSSGSAPSKTPGKPTRGPLEA